MREIRFRGKVLQSSSYPEMVGEWVYGHYIEDLHEGRLRGFIFSCPTYFQVDPRTVGQFTGLRDKNEHRIYDGDIVSANIERMNFVSTVQWGIRSNGWTLKCDRTNREKWGTLKYYKLPAKHKIEVIGNIFDNHKLLEK